MVGTYGMRSNLERESSAQKENSENVAVKACLRCAIFNFATIANMYKHLKDLIENSFSSLYRTNCTAFKYFFRSIIVSVFNSNRNR